MIDEPLNVGSHYFAVPENPHQYFNEEEKAALAQLEQEARARMEADQGDPASQQFFMREDTKTVVKDEKEYEYCNRNRISLKVVSYTYATHLLKEEDAKNRKRLKVKNKRKAARKARKVNR